MELIYRGVCYNVTPAHVDVIDAPMTGQYRGATIKFQQLVNLPVVQQVLHLIYRGVAFDEAISTPIA